ncbi:glycosyltransferase family 4 protein [Phycicoccus sp. Soil748]|uniref:glycosyltransferase family 4 protein n=1 Tax=Phycicoccus sp. Soil748 TaxID=1736397 RepID=UPI0007026B87|nr:glycosyltransferase family 4 protein [Phycicoccus sp. Soil748]KRE58982.1 hypothetical protein ASG70_17315 [Phycicoccus sp. Soil748]
MRILHATDTFGPTLGGIEVMVDQLASAQARAGHDVTVLTRTPGPDTPPAPGTPGVCRRPGRLTALLREADVVHGHVSAWSPLAMRAVGDGARADVPAVATVHSMWGAAWPAFRAAAVLGGWTGRPVQWAAVSDAAARPVRRALREREVLVIPNAVDTAFWAPHTDPRPRPEVTVVAVGRMHRRKRPLRLVSVLEQARANVPAATAIRAVVVGDGPQHRAFRREVAARGMQSWVHAPGNLSHEQIRALYADADVFVAPATLESFGIAALEARTAGLVVLAREHTGVGAFVDHGVDGLLSGSDAQMAEQLADLCADPVTRGRMAAHNRATVPALDWENVLHRNEHAYAAAGAVEHACLCVPVA